MKVQSGSMIVYIRWAPKFTTNQHSQLETLGPEQVTPAANLPDSLPGALSRSRPSALAVVVNRWIVESEGWVSLKGFPGFSISAVSSVHQRFLLHELVGITDDSMFQGQLWLRKDWMNLMMKGSSGGSPAVNAVGRCNRSRQTLQDLLQDVQPSFSPRFWTRFKAYLPHLQWHKSTSSCPEWNHKGTSYSCWIHGQFFQTAWDMRSTHEPRWGMGLSPYEMVQDWTKIKKSSGVSDANTSENKWLKPSAAIKVDLWWFSGSSYYCVRGKYSWYIMTFLCWVSPETSMQRFARIHLWRVHVWWFASLRTSFAPLSLGRAKRKPQQRRWCSYQPLQALQKTSVLSSMHQDFDGVFLIRISTSKRAVKWRQESLHLYLKLFAKVWCNRRSDPFQIAQYKKSQLPNQNLCDNFMVANTIEMVRKCGLVINHWNVTVKDHKNSDPPKWPSAGTVESKAGAWCRPSAQSPRTQNPHRQARKCTSEQLIVLVWQVPQAFNARNGNGCGAEGFV